MKIQKIKLSNEFSKMDKITHSTLKIGLKRFPHIPVTYMITQLVMQEEKMILKPSLYLAYVININNTLK